MDIKVFALGSEILFYNKFEKWRPRRTPVRVRLLDELFGRLKQRILAIRAGGRHFLKFGINFIICRPYGVRKYARKQWLCRIKGSAEGTAAPRSICLPNSPSRLGLSQTDRSAVAALHSQHKEVCY